jgi:hypothetical protein
MFATHEFLRNEKYKMPQLKREGGRGKGQLCATHRPFQGGLRVAETTFKGSGVARHPIPAN